MKICELELLLVANGFRKTFKKIFPLNWQNHITEIQSYKIVVYNKDREYGIEIDNYGIHNHNPMRVGRITTNHELLRLRIL
jgi:hypothetical protein